MEVSKIIKVASVIILVLVVLVFILGFTVSCKSTSEVIPTEVTAEHQPNENGCSSYHGRDRALCYVEMNKGCEELKNTVPSLKIVRERRDDIVIEHHRLSWISPTTKKEYKITTWDETVNEPTFMSKLTSYGIVGGVCAVAGFIIGKLGVVSLLLL